MNNLTAQLGQHHALTIDVCRAGDAVAFHFQTLQGVISVIVSFQEFLIKCRGPVDSNMRPLPAHEVYPPRSKASEPPSEPPSEPAAAELAPAGKKIDRRLLKPAVIEKYETILAEFRQGKFPTLVTAVNHHGARYTSFISRLHRCPRGDLRTPYLKPGGKLL